MERQAKRKSDGGIKSQRKTDQEVGRDAKWSHGGTRVRRNNNADENQSGMATWRGEVEEKSLEIEFSKKTMDWVIAKKNMNPEEKEEGGQSMEPGDKFWWDAKGWKKDASE